jgi:ATP-dependent phosphofructokinase / diphosphate-dependent phosphofructokinase
MNGARTALKRIGILTGGGDAPGLNAVIRAVVKSAASCGCEVIGLEDSFDGLIEPNRSRVLTAKDVTGILRRGGTILGTVNRGDPFAYPIDTSDGKQDYSHRVVDMFHRMGFDALVVIGGDGTLAIAHKFAQMGIPLVGVPKTIDNDISSTDRTFGFDTAVGVATEAVDRLKTTAESHQRVMVVEVMGRHAGWSALESGMAGGAHAICLPERPFNVVDLVRMVEERFARGKKFAVICVAEGAHPAEGSMKYEKGAIDQYGHERFAGIGNRLAAELERRLGKEARPVILGHVQRGGTPTAYDRVLATRFGWHAVEAAHRGDFGMMTALRGTDIVMVPLAEAVTELKTVPVARMDETEAVF